MRTALKKKKVFKKARKVKANSVPDVEFMPPPCQEQGDGCQDRCQRLERANAILVSAVTDQGRNVITLSKDFHLAKEVIGNAGDCAIELQKYILNYMEVATGLSVDDIISARNLNAIPAGVKDIDAATFMRAMHRVLSDLDHLVVLKELGN
jgi:hypothetical protein